MSAIFGATAFGSGRYGGLGDADRRKTYGGATFGSDAFGGTIRTFNRDATSVGGGVSTTSRTAAVGRDSTSVGPAGVSRSRRDYGGWRIGPDGDGTSVARVNADLTLSPTTLSLSWPADSEAWLRYDDVGDLAIVDQAGGRFRADRRDGDTPIQIVPPRAERPAVDIGAWLPADFAASQLNPQVREYQLDLQRPAPRGTDGVDLVSETGAYTVTFGADGIDASLGLGVDQVIESEASASPTGRETTLPLLVSPDQLATLAAICDRPAAVVERPVPDGPSRRVDTSPDSRHTVTLESPADAPLDDGTYLVGAWSAAPVGSQSRRWRVEVPFIETRS